MPKRTPGAKNAKSRDPKQPKPSASTSLPEHEPIPADTSASKFTVVGLGASAGGLAAFEAFFSGMPADAQPGMAFVLVQHLAPDHKSLLRELIQRLTRMEVFEVEDGMVLRPDCCFIIPPNHDMAILNGSFQLMAPSAPRGQRLPIDFFFRSLAQDQSERAVCIVLSGTGSDGTLGLRAIKGEGGMAMVQTPESTEYDGMPRSAIATGLVDYVLPAAEMPAQLIAYVGQTRVLVKPDVSLLPNAETAMNKIFVLLRSETSHDFSQYKPSTIQRRIERRMAVHRIEAIHLYVEFLQKTPSEIIALFHDLLIGVTNFFRDPEAFDALEKLVIPKVFAGKSAGSLIRVWSPGCSTGEEAYSIAILLQEQMEALNTTYEVQVFATDIDTQAIATARAGLYPASIAADLTPNRLSKFFAVESDGSAYRVRKNIRDMLIFSEQDLIKDPPFSRLDLISCRNLLIYMNGDLQKKLIPLFHYALNPEGFLFLGTSETVGEFGDRYTSIDRKMKLYQSKAGVRGPQRTAMSGIFPFTSKMKPASPRNTSKMTASKNPLRELIEQSLLQQVAPAGALVNDRGDILYLHGRTGFFLEPAAGDANMYNILSMAREGLRPDLAVALHKAVSTKATVECPGLRVKTNGDFSLVDLTIRPIAQNLAIPSEPTMYLVTLEKMAADAIDPVNTEVSAGGNAHGADENADTRIAALQKELKANQEYLRSTTEELETSNEELKSSNEEMQSVNEELQSTNEELETSKEELQSVNEELATVNSELQTKVTDLSRTNDDMNNLLAGTGIATVFVDHALNILRFTPDAAKVIHLIQSDIGRPVGHLASNLIAYDRLTLDTQSVLNTLIPKELEVQSTLGEWYMMRIRPYRTLENVIEGAVLTFADITALKKAQEALLQNAEELRRLAVVVRDSNDAIIAQDLEGHILAWNLAAKALYGWSESEALAMNMSTMIPEEERSQSSAIVQQLGQGKILESYRVCRLAKSGKKIVVSITASALVAPSGKMYAVSTTERMVEAPNS